VEYYKSRKMIRHIIEPHLLSEDRLRIFKKLLIPREYAQELERRRINENLSLIKMTFDSLKQMGNLLERRCGIIAGMSS